MKTWQKFILAVLAGLATISLVGMFATIAYAVMTTQPAEPVTVQVEQVPVQPIIVTVPVYVDRVITATPAPEQLSQPEQPTQPAPTPIPQVEVYAPACTDLANVIAETPYFKTWAPSVTAQVTVYNLGDCIWDEYYLGPYNVPIPYTMPGTFQALAFEIQTSKGLNVIPLVVYNQKGEAVSTGVGGAPENVAFDYANPASSVPPATIIVNVPTQDWEGIIIDWPKYYRIGGWDYWCWGGT